MPAASYRSRKNRQVDTSALHHFRYLSSTYNYLFGDEQGEAANRKFHTFTDNTSNGLSVRCLKNVYNT